MRRSELKTGWSLALLVLNLCLSSIAAHSENGSEKIAAAAAEKWLGQVDAGKYAESWKEASTYFQGAVAEKAWVESLNGIRKPLGKLVSRKLKNARNVHSLPGAPDGDYVVMQFDTSLVHKKSAVETVTFVREKSSKWKAAGYYIK